MHASATSLSASSLGKPAPQPLAIPTDIPADNNGWRRTMRTSDVDAHVACQPGWHINYEQLSAGPFHGAIDHLRLSGMSLIRETANCAVRQFGELEAQGYHFGVVNDVVGELLFNGQRLYNNSVMAGPSNDLELCSSGPCQVMGIIVDATLLHSVYAEMFNHALPAWFERQSVVLLDTSRTQRMRQSLQQAFDTIAETPTLLNDTVACHQLRDTVLLEWLNVLPEELDSSDLKSVAARRKVVDRACRLILSRHEEPVSLLEICRQIGASERKLNYCFQELLGISPGRYLRASRLNAVRRELKRCKDPRSSVQDIAAHWGFWHMGQFSTDYKHQFAELPSETLRTARSNWQPA